MATRSRGRSGRRSRACRRSLRAPRRTPRRRSTQPIADGGAARRSSSSRLSTRDGVERSGSARGFRISGKPTRSANAYDLVGSIGARSTRPWVRRPGAGPPSSRACRGTTTPYGPTYRGCSRPRAPAPRRGCAPRSSPRAGRPTALLLHPANGVDHRVDVGHGADLVVVRPSSACSSSSSQSPGRSPMPMTVAPTCCKPADELPLIVGERRLDEDDVHVLRTLIDAAVTVPFTILRRRCRSSGIDGTSSGVVGICDGPHVVAARRSSTRSIRARWMDSDGDGVGDLPGVIARLDYLSGSASTPSGCRRSTRRRWSTSATTSRTTATSTRCSERSPTSTGWSREAHARGIQVLLDWVPNHTSDQHPWFVASRSSRDHPKRDWYIWRDPRPDGGPPSSWLNYSGNSTWKWDEDTQQYYYRVFTDSQPDLNWRNPDVREAMYETLRFWLRRGVDGFRIDVLSLLVEDDELRDNPPNPDYRPGVDFPYAQELSIYHVDRPETRELVRHIRKVVDEFGDDKVLLAELVCRWTRRGLLRRERRGHPGAVQLRAHRRRLGRARAGRLHRPLPCCAADRGLAELGARQPRRLAGGEPARLPAGAGGGDADADAAAARQRCTTATRSGSRTWISRRSGCSIRSPR